MSRLVVLLTLAAGMVFSQARAQSGAPAASSDASACLPATTLDELTKALDDAVSGPANKDRACLRQLMLPDARLTPVAKAADGSIGLHVLTVDGWIEAVQKRGATAFYERQVKVVKQQYGHIAHLWCDYEIRPTPDGTATMHGVNSIEVLFDGSKWRVYSVYWESEATAGMATDKK